MAAKDPMQILLDEIKKEVRAAKDAEIANKAFAESMERAKGATIAWTEKINLVAGAMANLGGGKFAAIGVGISSLVANLDRFHSATTGSGKVGSFLNAMGAARQVMGNAIGGLGSGLKAIGSVAGVAAGGIGLAIGAFGSLAGVIEAPVKMIQGLADALTGFVSLVNPGVVQQFTLAMNDTMAVLGQAFTPVLRSLTIIIERVGDAFAGLLPVVGPMFEAYAQFIADNTAALGELVAAYAPFIQLMTDALIPVLKEVSQAVAFLQGMLIELLNTITGFFGMESRFNKDAKSRGTAIRQTSVGTVEQFSKELFAKNLQYAFGKDVSRNPVKIQEDILKAMQDGKNLIRDIARDVKEVADWIRNRADDAKDLAKAGGNVSNIGLESAMGLAGIALGKMWIR